MCSCVLPTTHTVTFIYRLSQSRTFNSSFKLLLYYCSTIFINKIYISDFVFCLSPLSVRLSPLTPYYIPRDGPQSSYMEYISALPSTEHPEVFGQHFNADIASQIAETRTLFDTLLSLQPQVTNPSAAGARPSREDKVRWGQGEDDRVEWHPYNLDQTALSPPQFTLFF